MPLTGAGIDSHAFWNLTEADLKLLLLDNEKVSFGQLVKCRTLIATLNAATPTPPAQHTPTPTTVSSLARSVSPGPEARREGTGTARLGVDVGVESKIFGRNSGRKLKRWETAVNKASLELYKRDEKMVYNREKFSNIFIK